MSNIPSWAVKPEVRQRVFLEVKANPEAETERVCIDSKSAYLIGRNKQTCDFPVPDKSASRVHACIAYKQKAGLQIPVLKDLGSVHGKSGPGLLFNWQTV